MKYKNSYYWFLWTGFLTYIISLNLPLIKITKLFVFRDEISLISMLRALWQQHEIFLFLVISCFVIIVPICKFTLLFISGVNPAIANTYQRTYKWLTVVGKWAMLDVFVAAIVIVIIKLGMLTQANTKIGLYLFVYSILASMVCTQLQRIK